MVTIVAIQLFAIAGSFWRSFVHFPKKNYHPIVLVQIPIWLNRREGLAIIVFKKKDQHSTVFSNRT